MTNDKDADPAKEGLDSGETDSNETESTVRSHAEVMEGRLKIILRMIDALVGRRVDIENSTNSYHDPLWRIVLP